MARSIGWLALLLIVARPSPAQPAAASLDDYVDQVITTDSQGWSVYSYDPHSVHDSMIVSTQSDGTSQIHASYSYGSGTADEVDLIVEGDKVVCIQYAGEPCRKVNDTPSHTGEIVMAGLGVLVAGAVLSSMTPAAPSPDELARRSQCKTDCANRFFSSDPTQDNQQRIACIRFCG